MAVAPRELWRDDLLDRYRRALMSYEPQPEDVELPPGQDIRTCTHCGSHARFRLDPEGTWYACTVCGQYA
jgi:hypothetical protein